MHNHRTLFKLRPWSNSILPELARFFDHDADKLAAFVRRFANTRFACPDLATLRLLQSESDALDLIRQDASPESQLDVCKEAGIPLTRLREIYAADAGERLAGWTGAADPVATAAAMAEKHPRQNEDVAILFDLRGAELRAYYAAIGRRPPPGMLKKLPAKKPPAKKPPAKKKEAGKP